MQLILLLFFFVFANATLTIDIPPVYHVKILEGDITYKNNQLVINGNGKIKFLKNDYESIPYEVNENIQSLVLKNNLFYKCIDNSCIIKKIKGQVKTKFKNHIKIDHYTFIGKLKIENNKFIFESGELVYKNLKYIGQFNNNNLFNGYGRLLFNFNDFYMFQDGLWKNGEFVKGQEKVIYSDGTVYDGAAYLSQPDGYGIVQWVDGDKFVGYFSNGKKDGKGKYFYNDGSYFEGYYKNDLKNGEGNLYIKPLNTYIYGNYKNDKLDGLITYFFDNNIVIVKFSNGQFIKIVKIIGNANISLINKILQPFLLNAWGFDNLWKKVKQGEKWIKAHKQHIINAAKGCIGGAGGGAIAGAVGGAATGAVTGAVAGGGVGALPGAIAGAEAGAIAGAWNGCVNQATKAWKNTNKNKNYKVNIFKASKEELSWENVVVGATEGTAKVFSTIIAESKYGKRIFNNKVSKDALEDGTGEVIGKYTNQSDGVATGAIKGAVLGVVYRSIINSKLAIKTTHKIKNFLSKYEKKVQKKLNTVKEKVKNKVCEFSLANKIPLCKNENQLKPQRIRKNFY